MKKRGDNFHGDSPYKSNKKEKTSNMFEVRISKGASKQKQEAFDEVLRIHHDQGNFKKTRSFGDLIKINGTGRERVHADVTAADLEQLISQNTRGFEKRILTGGAESSEPQQKSRDETKQQLKQENENLRERLSEMESKMQRVEQMHEDDAESDEGKSDTNDRLEDLYEEAGLNEPEL
jgi:regulator of replication initiation timing